MKSVTEQLTLYSVYLKFSGLRGCCFGIANMILVSHYEIFSFHTHTHTHKHKHIFSLLVFYLGSAWSIEYDFSTDWVPVIFLR